MIKQYPLKSSKAYQLYSEREFVSAQYYDWFLDKAATINPYSSLLNLDKITCFFMASDLHLTLNHIVEKQNAMVDGKYKKARLYLFETDSLIISAMTETGNRGSFWHVVEKDNMNIPPEYYRSDAVTKFSPERIQEICAFFRELAWAILDKNQEIYENYAVSHADFMAELQEEFGEFQLVAA